MKSTHFLISICMIRFLVQYGASELKDNFIVSKEEGYITEALKIIDSGSNYRQHTIFVSDRSYKDSTILSSLYSSMESINLFEIAEIDILKNHARFRHIYLLNSTTVKEKLNTVSKAVIIVSHEKDLDKVLNNMRDSIWWNHAAYFIIINERFANSCLKAYDIFDVTWSYKILSALYICRNLNDSLAIYTFNPYANLAPKFWSIVQTNHAKNRNLALFNASIDQVHKIYKSNQSKIYRSIFFFDKTKNLNGYNLKVVLKMDNREYRYDPTKIGYDRFVGFDFKVMATVLRHINATVTVKNSSILAYVDENGILQGMGRDVATGVVDILMIIYFVRDYWKIQAHSFFTGALNIISLKKPFTYTDKVASILTFEVCIFIFIGNIAFIVILKFVLSVSIHIAALEFVRIFTRSSTLREPFSTFRKILFLYLMLIALAFSSYTESLLSMIRTVNYNYPTIDTIENMISTNLSIYSYKSHKDMIWPDTVRKRVIALPKIKDCFDRLRNGDRVCLFPGKWSGYYNISESLEFHVSKGKFFEKSSTFTFVEDSPLLQKCHLVLLKMSEGGLINFFYIRELRLFCTENLDKNNYTVKNMSIEDVIPILCALVGSWILGIYVFVCELLISI